MREKYATINQKEAKMTERQKRREERLKRMQVQKTSLYSDANNSFTQGLSPSEAWELVAKISREMWFMQTGQKAPNKIDKQQVKITIREP